MNEWTEDCFYYRNFYPLISISTQVVLLQICNIVIVIVEQKGLQFLLIQWKGALPSPRCPCIPSTLEF
jgi:hypothetical protein